MGIIFKPRNVARRREIIERSLLDLTPHLRDEVLEMLNMYSDEELMEKLIEKLGRDKAYRLISKLKSII